MEPVSVSARVTASLAAAAARAVAAALARSAARPDPPRVVAVSGEIRLVGPSEREGGRRLSTLTQETFYGPDLNKIAATVRANQARNVADPQAPSQQLYVDNYGNIYFGDQLGQASAAGRRLSKVTQETFYGDWLQDRDLAEVRSTLPPGTTWASDGEVGGWLYTVVNEFGDLYDLFLWWEPASGTYKVSLVSPRLGGEVGVHDCHLYSDGTLCLKREGGSGYPALADAYARSVLWTRGASYFRRGYGFQFNVGQAGA